MTRLIPAVLLMLAGQIVAAAEPAFRPIFDGRTLEGWEGDAKVWRVEDGAIVGGDLARLQPRNDFLASRESFGDFELTFEVRLRGEGFVNSGVQFRSERVPNDAEMRGYQADIGPGWWGCLYDESRRNQVLAKPARPLTRVREGEWNRYRIVARGLRTQAWVNDEPAFDFTESDAALPRRGRLGLQIHGGGKSRVEFRNLRIRELGDANSAPTPPAAPGPSPLPARSQAATFSTAPGTVVELVAEESEGVGKFVAIGWDPRGRLWLTTALEYPVDANESPAAAAALYAGKGRDKVLVLDRPGAPGPQTPRVFADGLAIPTGMMPYLDGALVHHGTEIVRLRDTDGDGRADRRETLLSGFGTQDSHLLPHQFTRAPGGWIWMAQGAFNYGKVRTRDGRETPFDQTRMAKFKPDGGDFRITSNGPCNIWGLVLRETGEALIQEANDYGYPLMPFHEHANYPGCANGQWKSYAPEFPPMARNFSMGGSGLSGLAPADPGRWPEWARDLVWVANPIVGKVQSIRVTRGTDGWPVLEQGPDLLASSDPWFRPVAVSAGPDGCLYVVDWYNKIISHNEVPRNHPERDRVRGRVWRVRATDIPPLPQEDLMAAKPERLVALLGEGPAERTHLAWQCIVDRKLAEIAPALRARLADGRRPAAQRVPALWALEGLGQLEASTVRAALGDADANLRREALRALRDNPALSEAASAWAASLGSDTDFGVRQECIKLLGEMAARDPRALDALVRLARPGLDGPMGEATQRKRPIPVGAAYEREFERYLIRLALDAMPDRVAAYLDQDRRADLEPEAEAWAALSLGPARAAPRLARLLGRLGRPPSREELAALSQGGDNPLVAQALRTALTEGEGAAKLVDALLAAKGNIDRNKAAPLLTPSALALLARDENAELGLRLVAGFALKGTGAACERLLGDAKLGALALSALAATGEGTATALLPRLAEPAAIDALAASDPVALAGAWDKIPAALQARALSALASSRSGATALVEAALAGRIPTGKLDEPTLGRLQAALGEAPALEQLLGKLDGQLQAVARLDGSEEANAPLGIRLEGPMTLETWVWLEPGISNVDGLLGQPGVLDINFAEARPRVYLFPPLGDVVIARRPVSERRWTHLAFSRDAEGRWSVHIDGERDVTGAKTDLRPIEPRLAWTTPKGGLSGRLAEYRVWARARTDAEIRRDFDREVPQGDGLVFRAAGRAGWPKAKGLSVGFVAEPPPLLSAEAAARRDAAFARWEKLAAEGGGDPARGKAMATLCQTCHVIKGEGVSIGPELSAVGSMGTDALLRNLLTPNAAYEPGYRVFRLETREGRITEGFLVSEGADAVRLRLPGGSEVRFERADIARTEWLRRSIMPEGLVEALPDETARDLLAYLRTLR